MDEKEKEVLKALCVYVECHTSHSNDDMAAYAGSNVYKPGRDIIKEYATERTLDNVWTQLKDNDLYFMHTDVGIKLSHNSTHDERCFISNGEFDDVIELLQKVKKRLEE